MDDVAPGMAALHVQPVPWLEPEEVTAAVVFLASDAARHITGSVIDVDAGAVGPVHRLRLPGRPGADRAYLTAGTSPSAPPTGRARPRRPHRRLPPVGAARRRVGGTCPRRGNGPR